MISSIPSRRLECRSPHRGFETSQIEYSLLLGGGTRGQGPALRGFVAHNLLYVLETEGRGRDLSGGEQTADPFNRREIIAPPAPIHAGMEALPAIVRAGGERASRRFIEFFTASIRNRNTRTAYARAIKQFFDWCEAPARAP